MKVTKEHVSSPLIILVTTRSFLWLAIIQIPIKDSEAHFKILLFHLHIRHSFPYSKPVRSKSVFED